MSKPSANLSKTRANPEQGFSKLEQGFRNPEQGFRKLFEGLRNPEQDFRKLEQGFRKLSFYKKYRSYAVLNICRGNIKGKGKGTYKTFGFDDLAHLDDNKFVRAAKMVHRVATLKNTKLADEGITAPTY